MYILQLNYKDFIEIAITTLLMFALIFIFNNFSIYYSFKLQMQNREIILKLYLVIIYSFVS